LDIGFSCRDSAQSRFGPAVGRKPRAVWPAGPVLRCVEATVARNRQDLSRPTNGGRAVDRGAIPASRWAVDPAPVVLLLVALVLLAGLQTTSTLTGPQRRGDRSGHVTHASTLSMVTEIAAWIPPPMHPDPTPVNCHRYDGCAGLALWVNPQNAATAAGLRIPTVVARASDGLTIPVSHARGAPSLAALGVLRI